MLIILYNYIVNKSRGFTKFFKDDGVNVYYLNKKGREYTNTNKVRRKLTSATHYLVRNDLYIHLGMAYPVAMVVVLGGAIFVMIGNSEKGFSMMQKAGLGYLIVMIAPMILDVLVDAVDGAVS